MTASTAIVKFINSQGFNAEMIYPRAKITEIKKFKESCTSEEWQAFGKQACELLNTEFTSA